jgi:hypothetical protein
MSGDSSESRGGGGGLGAAFVLLIFVGAIVKFWVWIAVAFCVLAVGAALIVLFARLQSHARARRAAQAAIVARADEQHAQIMAGDDRGIYGAYPPATPPPVPERRPHAENWAEYLAETRRKALAGDDRGIYDDARDTHSLSTPGGQQRFT